MPSLGRSTGRGTTHLKFRVSQNTCLASVKGVREFAHHVDDILVFLQDVLMPRKLVAPMTASRPFGRHCDGGWARLSRSLALLCSARSTLLVYHGPTMSPSAPRKLKPHEVPYREFYPDTDADAERIQMEIYRRMPPWKKIQLVEEANRMSRALAMAGLRSRFPDASPDEIRRRFFGLWLGEELAAEVYGPLE